MSIRTRRPRCVVTIRGPGDQRLIVGPFASYHSANDYEARLRHSAIRHGVATKVHSETVQLDAPLTVANLRDLGVIETDAPLPE